MLAISGLNITMLAGSFFLLFLAMRVPRKPAAAFCMLIVALYIPLAGSGPPIQRAGFMSLMALAAVLMGRSACSLNALSAAFTLLLLIEPRSLWNVGFQLSFLSVFSLVAVLPLLPGHRSLPLSLGGSLAVLAGTFPLVLYYFNTFSPVGVIANIIAIPLFDAALFTALFTVFFHWLPLAGNALVSISLGLVTLGLEWVRYLSLWRLGYWFFVRPEAWQLGVYYGTLAALLVLARFRFPFKKFAVGICLAAWGISAISMVRTDAPRQFRLTVLAAGREPVLHAHFPDGSDWLVNTGRHFPSDQGERIVVPYLRHRGIKSLDGVVLTDLRKKHSGGLGAVLRDIKVRRIVLPPGAGPEQDRLVRLSLSHGAQCLRARKGTRIGDKASAITVQELTGRGMSVLFESLRGTVLFISDETLLAPELVGQSGPDVVIAPFLRDKLSGVVAWQMVEAGAKIIVAGGESLDLEKVKSPQAAFFDLSRTGALAVTEGRNGFVISPCKR